jgi:hypothetical protein
MAQRTPGPWTIYDESNDFHVMIKGHYPKSGGVHVADVLRRENAAAIVKWENSHDDLVKALEDLLRCGNAIIGASTDDPEAEEAFKMYDTARKLARAALAKAKS